MPSSWYSRINRRVVFLFLLLVTSSAVTFVALVIPFYSSIKQTALKVGDVAPEDILAPRDLHFFSVSGTEQQRQQAMERISPVYSPIDTNIARRQLERLRTVLSYITVVRSDTAATPDQKLADLNATEGLQLPPDVPQIILGLSDTRWQALQQESISVLEQVMRSTLRDNDIEAARANVPTFISLSLPEDQATVVADLVQSFVVPNSFYDPVATETVRALANQGISDVYRDIKAGEKIISRGDLITTANLEALDAAGLNRPVDPWEDYSGALILVLLLFGFIIIFLRGSPTINRDPRALLVGTLIFLGFLLIARLFIPGHTVLPYVFPMAGYCLLISALFGPQAALVTSLPLAILVTYGLPYALPLTLYYLLSGYFSVFALGRARRVSHFFWAGITAAASGIAVILAFRSQLSANDLAGLTTLVAVAGVNGLASAGLTLLLQFFLAQPLGMTTALQLIELSRPDHPLLQRLLRDAPGTYQHSLQVANLAEQAAEQIGADPLLTRVGSLYHDAGKAMAPVFFIENQLPGETNPHDELDPAYSAAMIIRHVPQGLELARKYRLPRRIQDFIAEHHGDMLARYQFHRAVEAAGGDESLVDQELYRYPGPAPRSRETALVMLADGCEARMRADHPHDEIELRKMIKNVVDNRLATGALDKTDLTLNDLELIIDSFTATLRGIYHRRLQYPQLDTLKPVEEK